MRKKLLFLVVVLILGCKQPKRYHEAVVEPQGVPEKIKAILQHRKDLNAEFSDPEASPLPDRYRKDFIGLDFFEPDTTYVVEARFERTPDAQPFFLATNTDRKTEEVVFGVAYFELNGASHQLEVYRSLDLIGEEGYEDYLFLPFADDTNGESTYGGGRYIDLTIPEGEVLVIDFNLAYNPYCVYNKKYSCPLVPRQNYLKTKVKAGVKDFKK
ncbi:DUF1684 domain-containing protein [Flagellimonas sp. DF-77]|uniref:DUF1684 domain-containing protein n=1 Tax=Flagellimonas algarum TaxID=3230298 RepID=UPI003395459E